MDGIIENRGRVRRALPAIALAIVIALAMCACENKEVPGASTQWKPIEGAEQEPQHTPVPRRTKEPRRTEIPHG